MGNFLQSLQKQVQVQNVARGLRQRARRESKRRRRAAKRQTTDVLFPKHTTGECSSVDIISTYVLRTLGLEPNRAHPHAQVRRPGCASDASHRTDQGHESKEPHGKFAEPVCVRNPEAIARLFGMGRVVSKNLLNKSTLEPFGGLEGGIWGSLGDRNPSRSRDSV